MKHDARIASGPRHGSARALLTAALLATVNAALAGCVGAARLTVGEGTGPHPTIPAPRRSMLPLVHVAPAIGWPSGGAPVPGQGMTVTPFARGLVHPRWVYVLPNGDVLVAETNAPTRPKDQTGIRGWFFKRFMKRAGAAGASANRITLLRDVDGDGVADIQTVLLQGLNSPFGIALIGHTLYVANTDAVVAFRYDDAQTEITTPGTTVVSLPAGPINHHWTKNIIAAADGSKLYVTVGSNSNAAENGIEAEEGRAAIWEVDPPTGRHRIFASGLRNPVGMAWEPVTGALWTAVNERDELGSDLVPDYITAVHDGAFYGWPYSYYGQHLDTRAKPERPDLVVTAVPPDYALGPHTASLGLASSQGNTLPPIFKAGMFVGQHGSWNREPSSGYRVIFVPFAAGAPNGVPVDVLTGFLNAKGEAFGRPVGVAIDKQGALLVADDVGNVIWRVTTAAAPATGPQLAK